MKNLRFIVVAVVAVVMTGCCTPRYANQAIRSQDVDRWDIDIYFEGTIALMFDRVSPPRAVFVYDNQHDPYIALPPGLDKNELAAAGMACEANTDCQVKLKKGVAFRVVTENEQEPTAIRQPANGTTFSDTVPHLKKLAPNFDPNNESANDQFPSQTTVQAYVELLGDTIGVFDPYPCRARFKGETTYRTFANVIRLHAHTTSAPVFEFKSKANAWDKVHFLAAVPPSITTLASNEPKSDPHSTLHFNMFEKLSKNNYDIPDIEIEPGCVIIQSLVPGCSNSQWP